MGFSGFFCILSGEVFLACFALPAFAFLSMRQVGVIFNDGLYFVGTVCGKPQEKARKAAAAAVAKPTVNASETPPRPKGATPIGTEGVTPPAAETATPLGAAVHDLDRLLREFA